MATLDTYAEREEVRKARAQLVQERFGVDPSVVRDDWGLADDGSGITFSATLSASVPVEWAQDFLAGRAPKRMVYPCAHWSPGRITYRKGCTACAAEGVEKVETD